LLEVYYKKTNFFKIICNWWDRI